MILFCFSALFLHFRCQDYILIDRGMGGTTEICGNSSSDDSVLELQSPEFTVFFRTSEEKKFRGFQMYIICFREADRDRRGYLLQFPCF